MAIYNVNQNRQFFVLGKKVTNIEALVKNKTVVEGDFECKQTDDGQIFFKVYGKGGLVRTDLIDLDKICYTRLTTKAEMQRYPKKAVVKLDTKVNGGAPISGQDYVLRVQINNFLAPGDACVYIKSNAVHATAGMTAAQFYQKMVDSLNRNFAREKDGAGMNLLEFKATANGIEITEVPDQPWRLGVLSQEPVNFEVVATTVTYQGDEVIWAQLNDKGVIPVTEDTTATPIGNGRQIADLEYFCQAERGDMFRNMGWPNNIDVKYMVDPTKEYDLLDLHYYFSGAGVQVHKSEKDITFASTTTAAITAIKTFLTGLDVTVKEKKAEAEEGGEGGD